MVPSVYTHTVSTRAGALAIFRYRQSIVPVVWANMALFSKTWWKGVFVGCPSLFFFLYGDNLICRCNSISTTIITVIRLWVCCELPSKTCTSLILIKKTDTWNSDDCRLLIVSSDHSRFLSLHSMCNQKSLYPSFFFLPCASNNWLCA